MEKAQHTTEPESIPSVSEFSKENFENQKPLLIQPKLSVGAVDDPFEREADSMADHVMRMPDSSLIQRKCASCEEEEKLHRMPETSFLQKKCASCEHDEEEQIHRKITPFIQKQGNGLEGGIASESVTNQINSSRGGGNRMSENTLSFMESRFNTDFSGIKIHTDSNAVQMSRDLNAQAFTVGSDIYFNAGKYSPQSSSGKHLLAHELTHTVQQGGGIERKVQRTGETGTSTYEESVTGTSTDSATPGVTRGTVTRREFAETDTPGQRRQIYSSEVDIIFDENACSITIPYKVQFVNQSATHSTHCIDTHGGSPDPLRPVSATTMRSVADNFLRANNEGLNGWFRLRLTNAPNHPCNGQNIPIVVQATEVTSNPDTTVIITANEGRSYVSGDGTECVLCNNPDYDVMVHEAGHMTLGINDEYSERDHRPAERERLTDNSRMAQVGPTRLQVFNERHFAFVPEFIRHLIPGCTASLIYGNRPRYTPIFYPSLSMSGIGGGIGGIWLNLGLDMGIPLDTLRRTEILIGPRAGLLLGSGGDTLAFLYGLRLGLSGTIDTRLFNQQLPIRVGTHFELGGGREIGGIRPTLPQNFSYMEMGTSLGLQIPSIGLEIRTEAGVGALDLNSPNTLEYFRFGAGIGGSF
jgi:Domain of unknown function (DUF4157)